MEPVTHFLTGACLGRAGFNRKTAYATLAAVLAAEAADLDIFWGFAGPSRRAQASSRHHAYFLGRARGRGGGGRRGGAARICWRQNRDAAARASRYPERRSCNRKTQTRHRRHLRTPAVHWGWLYLTACIAALSHLLLDWTNNYGVRPFFPFNPRWYAGSFMFIAEPILWGLFFLAFAMPWLLGLADREIGARRNAISRPGLGHLCAQLGCWCWAACAGPSTRRRWRCSSNTQCRLRAGDAHGRRALPGESLPLARDPRDAGFLPDRRNRTRWHPAPSTATRCATCSTSRPTRLPLKPPNARRWARCISTGERGPWCAMWARSLRPGMDPPNLPPNRTWTTVEFTDLRFDYAFLGTRSAVDARARSPAGSTSSTAATTPARPWTAANSGRNLLRRKNLFA